MASVEVLLVHSYNESNILQWVCEYGIHCRGDDGANDMDCRPFHKSPWSCKYLW